MFSTGYRKWYHNHFFHIGIISVKRCLSCECLLMTACLGWSTWSKSHSRHFQIWVTQTINVFWFLQFPNLKKCCFLFEENKRFVMFDGSYVTYKTYNRFSNNGRSCSSEKFQNIFLPWAFEDTPLVCQLICPK